MNTHDSRPPGPDLDDPRVALQRAEGHLAFDGEVEQPSWSGRPHADACFRTLRQDRVDDLDAAGGVAEAVPRDVKNYGWCQSAAHV